MSSFLNDTHTPHPLTKGRLNGIQNASYLSKIHPNKKAAFSLDEWNVNLTKSITNDVICFP